MCIVMCFPKGSVKTSEEVKKAIKQGLTSNSQSSGYCYRKAGEDIIHLKKGFLKESPEQIAQHIIDLNLSEDDVLIVHGRIPTDGASDETQAHPFICSTDPKEACKVEGTSMKPVLAHNGIFNKLGSSRSSLYSDTALFAMNIASDPVQMALMKKDPIKAVDIYKKYEIWGWSKVAILLPEKDTDIIYLGSDWITDSTLNIKASNRGYVTYLPNRGGHYQNPTMTSQKDWMEKVTGRESSVEIAPTKGIVKSTYYVGGSKEGSTLTYSDSIFRRSFCNHIIRFSNNRIIPNIFNYLFLNGGLSYPIVTNKVIPHNVPYILNMYRKEFFNIISFGKESEDTKILFNNRITDEVDYWNLLRLCEFSSKFQFTPALNFDDPKVSKITIPEDSSFRSELYDAFETYSDLISGSSHELDGTISKSYAKKLYNILNTRIGVMYFTTKLVYKDDLSIAESPRTPFRVLNAYSTNKNKLIDHHGPVELMECFTQSKLKHSIVTNKGYTIKEPSLLGIFLYYIERSENFGSSIEFNDLQIRKIICAEARKLNLLHVSKIPALISSTQQELALND